MDQAGGNVDPYRSVIRIRICWDKKGNDLARLTSFLILSNIIDGHVSYLSSRSVKRVAGDAWFSSPFLCLSFMREGEHLCLFAFRVRLLSQHRRKRMLRRAALPSMRNRAPSTRIGAARDPGPVSPPTPSLPPSPDPTTESRSEAEGELDGGGEAAQRQTDCTALLKEGRALRR